MSTTDPKGDSSESLQKELARLRRAVEELSVLNELSRSIGASLDSETVMHTIIQRSLHAVEAEQGVITLVQTGSDTETTTLVRTQVSTSQHPQYHIDQALLGWMHLNRKPLVVNEPGHDERFRGVHFHDSIRSLLCVPMMVKSELRGVLTLYNKKEHRGFSEDDQRLLAIIAAQSAQVVENARLYEEEKQLSKMKEELHLASRIQTDLLPKELPRIEGYDIAARTIPAEQVGGDYFDYVCCEGNRLAICLGDVSGKGLPASLLMANLQATLRGQTFLASTPKECLSRANTLLFRSTGPEKFATVFYAVLDLQQHNLCYSNAGQDRPILLTAGGEVRRLAAGGIPLGLLEEWTYEDECVHLRSGDVLAIFSDGIREAVDVHGEHFGDERAVEVVKAHAHLSAEGLIDAILRSTRSHVGDRQQSDDMTLLVLRRL